MDQRPPLNKEISVKDFRDFYWLKEELLQFCKAEGLKRSGGKIEVADRIAHYLSTGEKELIAQKTASSKSVLKSKFDWNTESLTVDTIITNSYKNTENVRQFFEQEIGPRFKFNVKFMNWMKANEGKSLADAIKQWKKIAADQKSNKAPKDIAPQFEYNTYLRDFLADNPDKSRAMGIRLWKIKRSMRGDNVYRKSDLKFINP